MSEMKTPREWMLEGRAHAEHKLDLLRQAALPTCEITWSELGRELFRPYRTLWRAIAIIWMILLAIHFTQVMSSRPTSMVPPPPEALAESLMPMRYYESLTLADHQL